MIGTSSEQQFMEGERAFARRILRQCHVVLGGFDGRIYSDLLRERDEVRAALRRICEHHGDNDWPDDLHLADVIVKHLEDHLGDRRKAPSAPHSEPTRV